MDATGVPFEFNKYFCTQVAFGTQVIPAEEKKSRVEDDLGITEIWRLVTEQMCLEFRITQVHMHVIIAIYIIIIVVIGTVLGLISQLCARVQN